MITREEIRMDIALYSMCLAKIKGDSIDRIDPRYVRRTQDGRNGHPYCETNKDGEWLKSDNIVELKL